MEESSLDSVLPGGNYSKDKLRPTIYSSRMVLNAVKNCIEAREVDTHLDTIFCHTENHLARTVTKIIDPTTNLH